MYVCKWEAGSNIAKATIGLVECVLHQIICYKSCVILKVTASPPSSKIYVFLLFPPYSVWIEVSKDRSIGGCLVER